MTPNIVSDDSDSAPLTGDKTRKEILYNGYFYDITDFIDRHPGGSVIKFYTEAGEDATQAIDQFHFRARKRVDGIMSGFKKRPAELHERGLSPRVLTRHEAMSKDFKNLFEELVAEGYFEPSIPEVILRSLDFLILIGISYGAFLEMTTFWGKFVAIMFCAVTFSRLGWIQHECGHRSFTGNGKADRLLQAITTCLLCGGSAAWWNSQHNRHHAMPQRLHHDVDLATLPFLAFNARTVRDRKEVNSFFVRYQAIFHYTIDMMLVLILWRLILHPSYQIKKRAYFEMFLSVINISLLAFAGPGWLMVGAYWFLLFLGSSFALSHTHLDVADKPTHWLEYSLTHTANISPNMWVDYWMGYSNYQIEHHLFPTMPQFRQREISPRVKALAEKYGLTYRVYSYPEAFWLVYKNLDDVGKELTRKDRFTTN